MAPKYKPKCLLIGIYVLPEKYYFLKYKIKIFNVKITKCINFLKRQLGIKNRNKFYLNVMQCYF